ncbi:MAG TPA: cytochrome c3 family protein [Gemmatimonadales bacterium]|nr:cytochrome c3 family protein [Gemmatimonadales bacterium]
MRHSIRIGYLVLGSVLALAAAGCVKDNTTAPSGVSTKDAAFVGYSNPDTKLTTCGNCHIDRQTEWASTKHASAWADLQASGEAASYCYQCHTTNGFSNLAQDSAGYFAVPAASKKYYQDVQCEACHGPGATHIGAPDETQPLASIQADTGLPQGCGTCHTGTHSPFVDQWVQSGHGTVEPAANGNASCIGCHSGQGALARFDQKATYLEETSGTWQPITCAVCHDPHGSPNPAQLRYPISTADLGTNLCMQCHYRRSAPDPTSTRGAHSPQGPMLLGEAGWIPPNFQYNETQEASTHGSSANPTLCAGCHVEPYDVTDKATGKFVIHSTGHLFRAIPCSDSTGAPVSPYNDNCSDSSRRYNACTVSGCHATGAQAMADRQVLTGRLQGDVRTLWVDANGNGVLDTFPVDSGLLAMVRQKNPSDFALGTISVGFGAWFNADMINRADGSYGVHNPIYAEALLLGSIQAVRAQYTYLPPAPPAEAAQMRARMQALGMKP